MRGKLQMQLLNDCLRDPLLRPYISWCFDSNSKAMNLMRKGDSKGFEAAFYRGDENNLAALAAVSGQFENAEKFMSEYYQDKKFNLNWNTISFRMYLLLIAGNYDKAKVVGQEYIDGDLDFMGRRSQMVNTLLQMLKKSTE